MATPEQYINATVSHQIYTERVKTHLDNQYQEAVEEIRKGSKRILYGLDVENISDLSKKELNALLAELAEYQQAVYDRYNEQFNTDLEELNQDEIDWEYALLLGVLGKDAGKVLKKPKTTPAFKLTRNTPMGADQMPRSPVDQMKRFVLTAIDKLNGSIVNSWANKLTITETVKGISEGQYNAKKKTFKITGGTLKSTKTTVSATTRTVSQFVLNRAKLAVYAANSTVIVGYRWISVLDGRTSDICRSLSGKIFKVGEGPIPPAHPNCRSSIVPDFFPKYDSLNKNKTIKTQFGPVDSKTTYYTWLKGATAEFQNDVLGPTRGKLFREGGLTSTQFANLNIGRNFDPMTIAEMREKNPLAFRNAGL